MNKKIPKDTIIKRVNDWLCAYQNITDSYFNATQFLKDYNKHNLNNQKLMKDFLRLDSTKKLILKLEPTQLTEYQIYGDISINTKTDKLVSLYLKQKRNSKVGRSTDVYFFCKELFFEFGCWLSVDLRLDLYKIVWDNVVEYRQRLKGKFSKEFTDAVTTIEPNPLYPKLYSVLNKAVFGKNKNNENQRDTATEEQLKLMYKIENEIITLIEWKYVKTFDDILNHIRKYYPENVLKMSA